MARPGTRRDDGGGQGARTEARLLEAGMAVLADRGFHAARVDDIVRVADVSHGTFYLYFANKEDLLRTLAVHCAQEMTALAASLGEVDAGDAGAAELRRWVAAFVAAYRRYGAVIRSWTEGQVRDRQLTRLGAQSFGEISDAFVARLQAAGVKPEAEARRQAVAMLAMVERFTYFVTSRETGFDESTVLDTLAGILHRGFFGAAA